MNKKSISSYMCYIFVMSTFIYAHWNHHFRIENYVGFHHQNHDEGKKKRKKINKNLKHRFALTKHSNSHKKENNSEVNIINTRDWWVYFVIVILAVVIIVVILSIKFLFDKVDGKRFHYCFHLFFNFLFLFFFFLKCLRKKKKNCACVCYACVCILETSFVFSTNIQYINTLDSYTQVTNRKCTCCAKWWKAKSNRYDSWQKEKFNTQRILQYSYVYKICQLHML